MLVLALALAVPPGAVSSAQERGGYALGVVVRGQHACRVCVYSGTRRPPDDGRPANFNRVMKPGDSAVMPFDFVGAWWQHTIGRGRPTGRPSRT